MRDEEVFITIVAMLLFGGITVWTIVATGRARSRKLQILETALRNVSLDEPTKHLLIKELTRPNIFVQALQAIWQSGKLLGAIGWIGIFIGLAMLVSGDRYAWEPGLGITFVSFAVLTLPFAMRELETRRRTAAAPRDMP